MEKNPAERFQSARDLAFALRAISNLSHGSGQTPAILNEPERKARNMWPWLTAVAGLIAIAAIGLYVRASGTPAVPRYSRITFQRGFVSARALRRWQEHRVQCGIQWGAVGCLLHSRRIDGFAPLSVPGGHVFSISNSGDLAIALNVQFRPSHGIYGTLARVPLAAARRVPSHERSRRGLEPNGDRIAVAHMSSGIMRIEFPAGKVLYETSGWIGSLRFSPDGKHLAFSEHPLRWDDRATW